MAVRITKLDKKDVEVLDNVVKENPDVDKVSLITIYSILVDMGLESEALLNKIRTVEDASTSL